MQLAETTITDSFTFIEKKRVENRFWRKRIFVARKKMYHHEIQQPSMEFSTTTRTGPALPESAGPDPTADGTLCVTATSASHSLTA